MIVTETHIEKTCEVKVAVLFALQYFSIWKYPLKFHEIHANCNIACSNMEVEKALENMLETGEIFYLNGYYSIQNNLSAQVTQREKGNFLALKKMPAALYAGNIIYKFPFVRFVGISGSLSKNYAEEKSDFDFFIITEKNRLWICRSILHVFKKLTFLAGQQHKFCMNYFVDDSALEIEEKNQYTATELVTLIPVAGRKYYTRLKDKNTWIKHFLPNAYMANYTVDANGSNIKYKLFAEILLNWLPADKINQALMNVTNKRWLRKWSKKQYPLHEYEQAFKTRINISKNHPANYQKKVLLQLSKIQQTAIELLKK